MMRSAASYGIQPRRVAITVAIWVALAGAVALADPPAGFIGGLLVVAAAPICFTGTRQAIGMWRGTVSHTVIATFPRRYFRNLENFQAGAPCGTVAADGCVLAIVVVIFGGGGDVASAVLLLAGVAIGVTFGLLCLCVCWLRRPRLLLPATMRRGDRRDPAVV